jgi:hypothetical protein
MTLLEEPMLAEHPVSNSIDARIDEPVDVVVLVAPDQDGLSQQFVDALAAMKTQGAAAVLVVYPRFVDAETLRRASNAGADHCVVAPSSRELFSHIERARSLRRQADAGDDPLDTFWRARSHRA